MSIYKDKKVLLVAGGGTLGTHISNELLRLGAKVDIICLEDKVSDNENLRFFKHDATIEYLEAFLAQESYDGIVNLIHYPDAEKYRPYHKLLSANTKHLIITSSYRIYANEQIPITESAPTLYAASKDEEFVAKETYAISKAKIEAIAKEDAEPVNWTIIRPVISFSEYRFDVVMRSGHLVIDAAKEGKTVLLPEAAKNVTAGVDWAGNTGKLIANLMFKKEALGEAYTISSAPNLTWKEIADLYTELVGTKFEWVDMETYREDDKMSQNFYWALLYDRLFDRKIDNTKVLKATGLGPADFLSVREGLMLELAKIKK